MARAGPRKVRAYNQEFKLTTVRLSQQPGLQVQAVAAALDIHPFVLSKWRTQVRDAALRQAIAPYVRYYNHRRRHSAQGYRSPVDYEAAVV